MTRGLSMRMVLLAGTAVPALMAAGAASAQTPMPAGSLNQPGFFGVLDFRFMSGFGGLGTYGADVSNINGGDSFGDAEELRSAPGFGPGFRLGLGMQSAGNWDYGIYGSYQRAKGEDSASHPSFDDPTIGNGGNFQNGFLTSPQDGVWQNGTAETKLKIWALDLESGYGWMPSPGVGLRLFGGLRIGRVSNQMTANFNGQFGVGCDEGGVADSCTESNAFSSRFIGAGPRLGVNGSIPVIGQNIHLTGMVASSLLVGRSKTDWAASFFVPPGGNDDFSGSGTTRTREARVVPVFEGEVGLTYGNIMMGRMAASLSLGYRIEYWLGATDQLKTASGGEGGGFTLEKANIGSHGPVIRGAIKF